MDSVLSISGILCKPRGRQIWAQARRSAWPVGALPTGLAEDQAWKLGSFEASSCVRTVPTHIWRPVRRKKTLMLLIQVQLAVKSLQHLVL